MVGEMLVVFRFKIILNLRIRIRFRVRIGFRIRVRVRIKARARLTLILSNVTGQRVRRPSEPYLAPSVLEFTSVVHASIFTISN